jgi:hypothetical protein
MTRPNPAIAAVSTLLEQQKQALLTGDLKLLDQLPDRLEQAMRKLAEAQTDAMDLTPLAKAAERNARLVLSARDGLARARRDIAPATPLTTYDAQGRRQPPSSGGQLISRR